MPLQRMYFDVLMDDPNDQTAEPVEHRVEIRATDQLRAELEGRKLGVDHRVALHTTYLWAWAAMVRTGLYEGGFKDYEAACVLVKGAEDVDETVDPTRAATPAASA